MEWKANAYNHGQWWESTAGDNIFQVMGIITEVHGLVYHDYWSWFNTVDFAKKSLQPQPFVALETYR